MIDIAEEQLDATTDKVVAALTALSDQIAAAREAGNESAQDIVKKFGGENKLTDLIAEVAGYMGEATSATMSIGATPMIIMAGAAKGIYTKITDSADAEEAPAKEEAKKAPAKKAAKKAPAKKKVEKEGEA